MEAQYPRQPLYAEQLSAVRLQAKDSPGAPHFSQKLAGMNVSGGARAGVMGGKKMKIARGIEFNSARDFVGPG
ncbi:hypothetical protein Psta_3678 [Pirellula staleyi DSM 6068]|uniref:Uncharacterized protein n=1 Tax=Pirellula staleyi (strain ATCC 27377 / DSM 6068 / ICPB 4128) TaxID=530564 RepID=D2QZX1_PIRSD|nr:hypothetical protein Psta_3678 [Pirellula staleyi DSM 6068]